MTGLGGLCPPLFGQLAAGSLSIFVRWTTIAICAVWKRCSPTSVHRGLPRFPCLLPTTYNRGTHMRLMKLWRLYQVAGCWRPVRRSHLPFISISANLILLTVKNWPLMVRYSTSFEFDIAIANTGVVNVHSLSPVTTRIGLIGCINSVMVGFPS